MNAEVGKRHIYDTDTLTTTNTDINRKSNELSYKSKKKKCDSCDGAQDEGAVTNDLTGNLWL